MKKRKDFISKDLPPLRLHIDELREVYKLLAEYAKEPVTMQTGDYQLDNVDEAENLPMEQTHDLYIRCPKPHLRIRLTRTYGEIYAGEGNLEAEGLVSQIEKILLRGKVLYPVLPKSNWVFFLLGLPFALGLLLENKILALSGGIIVLVEVISKMVRIGHTPRWSVTNGSDR